MRVRDGYTDRQNCYASIAVHGCSVIALTVSPWLSQRNYTCLNDCCYGMFTLHNPCTTGRTSGWTTRCATGCIVYVRTFRVDESAVHWAHSRTASPAAAANDRQLLTTSPELARHWAGTVHRGRDGTYRQLQPNTGSSRTDVYRCLNNRFLCFLTFHISLNVCIIKKR